MTVSRRYIVVGALAALIAGVGANLYYRPSEPAKTSSLTERIVINEAARTLLYLPLYHAVKQGYFKAEDIDVEIVTGGTSTNSVSAIISGDADISIADPMYAPISQDNGSDVVVIGQIVGRIGLWAIARPGVNEPFDVTGLPGASIITHPRPMTAYTYTTLRLRDLGIAENGAIILEAKPGTEIATYAAETKAKFLVGVEPVISILESQGARVVYSWPETHGDRVFSGLMARQTVLNQRSAVMGKAVRALQRALDDIAGSDPSVFQSAKEYFPSLEDGVLRSALERLTRDQVFPHSVPGSVYNIRALVERTGHLSTWPTCIFLGPTLEGWSDMENLERVRKAVGIFVDEIERTWRDNGLQRYATLLNMAA